MGYQIIIDFRFIFDYNTDCVESQDVFKEYK